MHNVVFRTSTLFVLASMYLSHFICVLGLNLCEFVCGNWPQFPNLLVLPTKRLPSQRKLCFNVKSPVWNIWLHSWMSKHGRPGFLPETNVWELKHSIESYTCSWASWHGQGSNDLLSNAQRSALTEEGFRSIFTQSAKYTSSIKSFSILLVETFCHYW